ncbi:hypothetical protein Hanom_Chr05g00407691 [Helianthus anomalus]
MSTVDDAVAVEETGGALPPLKWDQGLIEQVVRAPWAWCAFGTLSLYVDRNGRSTLLKNLGYPTIFKATLDSFLFLLRGAKKILINPPKSFHDWKMKFFYIREEVIPIAMDFRNAAPVPKEDMKISRSIYHRVFPAHAGVMGLRPLRASEEYWFERIRPNFIYARVDLFVAPPAMTEGAHIPNPRPCRAITPVGK